MTPDLAGVACSLRRAGAQLRGSPGSVPDIKMQVMKVVRSAFAYYHLVRQYNPSWGKQL